MLIRPSALAEIGVIVQSLILWTVLHMI